ncbi:MAG: hypothetical protein AAGF13_11355 [Pseudomonadota bacterium]
MCDLPPLALSVRQPWAWAIVAGFKKIENRSAGAIASGGMDRRRIAIHASAGLKEDEFRWGHWRLDRHGVRCPHPTELARGAIIGAVDVVDIVSESDSEWFGGQMGLVLENALACEPIPCPGALGYFEWRALGELAKPTRWMVNYDLPSGDGATLSLFPDLPPSFEAAPTRPRRKK